MLGAIGKKSCEKTLEKILVEFDDRKIVNRVMNLILDFREGLRQLSHIPDPGYRSRLTTEWRDLFFKKVFEHPTFPTTVKTHLWCCMTAYYRERTK
jgi:hypothetical protein